MTQPTLGRTVIVRGPASNGTSHHPGVITRVWNERMVNVTVFLDNGPITCLTSVRFFESEEDAESSPGAVCYFPTKVM